MSLYSRWAKKEHSEIVYITALLLAGVVFLFLIPYFIIVICPRWDQKLGLHDLEIGVVNMILGGLLLISGMFFAFWSVLLQITRGRGTPLPMLPTQELLTGGPFRYCRNPMTFGTICAYLGIAVLVGTPLGISFVLLFGALLILYLKKLEEIELAERFGEAYLKYRREVPFIIPRLPPKH